MPEPTTPRPYDYITTPTGPLPLALTFKFQALNRCPPC